MDDNKCSEYESVTQNVRILPLSLLNLQSLSSQQTNIKLVSLSTSTSHILHVSSFLPPDPSSYYYYFFYFSPSVWRGMAGQRFGAGVRESVAAMQ